jgi:7-keto-8-aminopelargonate synthetase-like enzyme
MTQKNAVLIYVAGEAWTHSLEFFFTSIGGYILFPSTLCDFLLQGAQSRKAEFGESLA